MAAGERVWSLGDPSDEVSRSKAVAFMCPAIKHLVCGGRGRDSESDADHDVKFLCRLSG